MTDGPGLARSDGLILAGILALATVLRAVHLGGPLWYDEILTLLDAVRLPLGDLVSDYASLNNHVFYTVQAKALVAVFGESSWVLRLPAFVFGVLSIAATWQLVRVLADPLRAHVTALLIALSYHHVWYSQNARAYTELMFWFTVSTLALIRGVRAPTYRTWILYGVLMAAAVYAHLTAAMFYTAQALVVAAVWVTPWWRSFRGREAAGETILPLSMPITGFLIGGLVILALYAPSLPSIFESVAAVPQGSAVDVMPEYQSPLWTAREILRSFATPGPLVLLGALVGAAVTGLGLLETARRDRLVGATLVLHMGITLLVLVVLSGRIWPRFFFADMGFVLFFLVQGTFVVCRWCGQMLARRTSIRVSPRVLLVTATVVLALLSAGLLVRNYRFPKQDFDGALAYIESHRSAEDAVVTVGLAAIPYGRYFETGWPTVEDATALDTIRSGADRTWLVLSFPTRTSRRYADVMESVGRDFVLARRFHGTLGDGDVLVYVTRGS